jgi:hypothetical protein
MELSGSPISPPSPGSPGRSPREVALARSLPERTPWAELGPEFFAAWGYPRGEFQPEHVGIYGQTGRGKSWFERYILTERARLRGSRVVVVATKPADKTLVGTGWPVVTSWPPATGWTRDKRKYQQVIYWAKAKGLGKAGRDSQQAAVADLLEKLWVPDSNIIVAFDEIAYIEKELSYPPYQLANYTARYFREGRAMGITVVASTQRPTGVSRYMHSETAWSVFFAPKDEEDTERMAQVAGNKLYYRRALAELNAADYEFLMVHNLTGESYISSIPKKPIPIAIPIAIPRPAQESPKNVDRVA